LPGVAIIARPVSLLPILAAMERRFGGAEMVAVHARSVWPALRIVIRAKSASRGGLSIHAPLMMQEDDGRRTTQRAEAISAGQASLFGD
jgi:tRNA1(Val) A37 N6-methylase TrmN6